MSIDIFSIRESEIY